MAVIVRHIVRLYVRGINPQLHSPTQLVVTRRDSISTVILKHTLNYYMLYMHTHVL